MGSQIGVLGDIDGDDVTDVAVAAPGSNVAMEACPFRADQGNIGLRLVFALGRAALGLLDKRICALIPVTAREVGAKDRRPQSIARSGTVAAFEHTERSLANHVRRANYWSLTVSPTAGILTALGVGAAVSISGGIDRRSPSRERPHTRAPMRAEGTSARTRGSRAA